MKLQRLTEKIWFYPFEEERDRPNLGYIRGDRWSLAVDAGHSRDHTLAFYRELENAGLPLPALTVLTHWHWDHTFGMHSVHGLCAAEKRTEEHLRRFRERFAREGRAFFLGLDESIRLEYSEDRPVVITLPDMTFMDNMSLDAGNCPVHIFHAPGPHTDDSTLIHVPGEKTLFLGDAACGVFPTGEKDAHLAGLLRHTLSLSGADIFMEGHWHPQSLSEVEASLPDGIPEPEHTQEEKSCP